MGNQERAKLLERLRVAEEAYHRVMLGESVKVLVDQSGERIEFNAVNSGRLSAYIQELKRQLGIGGVGNIGPLRFLN